MKIVKTTIGELCLVGDGTHGKVKRQNGGVMYLSSKNFKANGLDLTKLDYISEEDFKKHFKKDSKALTKPKKDDILMSIIGTMGMPYVVKESDEFGISSSVCIIRPSDELIPQYLYYWMLSQEFQQAVINFKSGVAQGFLSLDTIRKLPLVYPSKKIQVKVVDIISKYDDLIENNLKRIKLLEESAELLYKEWFVNFRYPGYEYNNLKDSIPEGWEKVHLSNLVSTQYGYTESAIEKDTGYKYLRGTDINKSSYVDWNYVPWCNIEGKDIDKYKLSIGDILVIRMADPGKVGIIEKNIDAVFASYLIRLKIKNDRINPYYLFYFLNSEFYQKFISQASTGATRKSANAKLITDVYLLVPPKDIIDKFNTKIYNIRILLNNLLNQNKSLKEARDILIPKLITGEIEA